MSAPTIECDSVNPGFVVRDIKEAIEFYSGKLGFRLDFMWGEPPTFAAMTLGKISIHLIMPEGKLGPGTAYFGVDDADELHAYHKSMGVEIAEPIADREYSMRDYGVYDPFGNYLNFGHYIMPHTPALPIERVDVPLRLEKRLAALLTDLAEFKGMNINSLLEETLLHTFEPLGDSVASPHTKAQLRYIADLKKKHGIDYDVHASYRFVEGI